MLDAGEGTAIDLRGDAPGSRGSSRERGIGP
jgi:hypothetical protein